MGYAMIFEHIILTESGKTCWVYAAIFEHIILRVARPDGFML